MPARPSLAAATPAPTPASPAPGSLRLRFLRAGARVGTGDGSSVSSPLERGTSAGSEGARVWDTKRRREEIRRSTSAPGASSAGAPEGQREAGRLPLAATELSPSTRSVDRWVFLSAVHLEIRP